MSGGVNKILLVLLIVYLVSPIDFFPGPIDDILLAVAYAVTSKQTRLEA